MKGVEAEIGAMYVSQTMKIPTINGYSGNDPWMALGDYEQYFRNWLDFHRIGYDPKKHCLL